MSNKPTGLGMYYTPAEVLNVVLNTQRSRAMTAMDLLAIGFIAGAVALAVGVVVVIVRRLEAHAVPQGGK